MICDRQNQQRGDDSNQKRHVASDMMLSGEKKRDKVIGGKRNSPSIPLYDVYIIIIVVYI